MLLFKKYLEMVSACIAYSVFSTFHSSSKEFEWNYSKVSLLIVALVTVDSNFDRQKFIKNNKEKVENQY